MVIQGPESFEIQQLRIRQRVEVFSEQIELRPIKCPNGFILKSTFRSELVV